MRIIVEGELSVGCEIPQSKESQIVEILIAMGAGDGKHATVRVARVVDEAGSGAVVASINDIAIFIIDEKV